jgi:hypothetical protein
MTEEAIPVYLRYVHNSSNIGGVTTVDGKYIKEKMLFRSASPDNITGKGYQKDPVPWIFPARHHLIRNYCKEKQY